MREQETAGECTILLQGIPLKCGSEVGSYSLNGLSGAFIVCNLCMGTRNIDQRELGATRSSDCLPLNL
eukprot:331417-Hanusia_phi.AAC.2